MLSKSIEKILFLFFKGGCFVKDTPILMAGNNPFKAPAFAYSMALLPLVSPIQDIKPDDVVKSYHHEQSFYATADNNDKAYVPGWNDQMVADVGRDWSDTKLLHNEGTETNWISASTKADRNDKFLDYDLIHITPETWQIGTFEIIEANGDKVEVEANRPKTWYQENNVNAIGDKAHFYMPEIGINGNATLLSIRPTVINTSNFALNESRQVDRPVITTFKRNAPIVFDYHFSGGAVIGATPEHPFFSVDRNNYIAIGELQIGEQVMTAGEKVVKFIAGKQREKGEPVYNFEVWREHNYYVGSKESGEFLLVHNACPFPKDKKALAEMLGIDVKDVHDWVKDMVAAYKSKFPHWMGGNPDVGPGPNGKLAFKCTQLGANKGKIWESEDDFIDFID